MQEGRTLRETLSWFKSWLSTVREQQAGPSGHLKHWSRVWNTHAYILVSDVKSKKDAGF